MSAREALVGCGRYLQVSTSLFLPSFLSSFPFSFFLFKIQHWKNAAYFRAFGALGRDGSRHAGLVGLV